MIGERIKEIRLRKHYSITRLAEEAQISKSYLSQIEKGANTNPSLQMLYKIAASLGTTIDYLIDEKTDGVTIKESAPYITEEWLSLLNQAIRQGMTKEDFLEFHNYLQFKKNLQTWKGSRF
ncbi:transcriptional regulator [Priestia megaterium]|uniref:XRE family transcriptional regulator n=1 Tax=Priestia megaterium TaxID=1404 RepID=UPI000BFB95C7|nr:XRE family transcriptional regulator [Priestia megaterium]PGZ80211.1 transcriptional regulator [Priestia megaterium]